MTLKHLLIYFISLVVLILFYFLLEFIFGHQKSILILLI